MTNAEAIAKDTELLSEMIEAYCQQRRGCEGCKFSEPCEEHQLDNDTRTRGWLEQDRGMPWEDVTYEWKRVPVSICNGTVTHTEYHFECSNCKQCSPKKLTTCPNCKAKMNLKE